MESAPLFNDLADGPEGGRAFWERAEDGVRLRIAHWPGPQKPKATVLLFPGRTEYVEKYGRAARDLAASGYDTLCIDWRGQGLSERLAPDAALGHVGQFSDYQLDVQAMVRAARRLGLPRPFLLLSHSMGGCIALRALHDGLDVPAAMFSGPMWGIALPAMARMLAIPLVFALHRLGMGQRYMAGTKGETYVLKAPFEDNQLTTDADMWEYMRRQSNAHPELTLSGPSITWLREAIHECRSLVRMPAPAVPAHVFLGGNERIVDPRPIHDLMGRWPDGRLTVIPGAEHEIMMEIPQTRAAFFKAANALFAAHI